jgi:hypothetical protein
MLGYYAGNAITTGDYNIILGYQAGELLTTGGYNIVLGYDIDLPLVSSANMLDIGNLIYATGLTSTGTTASSGNVGIALSAPTARLHLPACAAAANTASLKIDAGTVATAAVSGNIESDGTHLYWTDSGGTRRQLDN